MKGRLPYKTFIRLEFHAKEGVIEAGEVIVVDATIDEGSRQSNLADVVLDREFLRPERQRPPASSVDGMVGHAAVDVMVHTSFLRGIGQRPSHCDFIPPVSRVYEG